MRLFPLLLLLCLPVAARAQGTWALLPASPEAVGRHDDVFFVSPDTGWVVNTRGSIYRTTDGGDTWTEQYNELTAGQRFGFRSVGFASARVGWVGSLTLNHVLFETRDGGDTWTDISSRISGPKVIGICGLWVVDSLVAYGVGRFSGSPRLVKTTDGGLSWTATDLSDVTGTLVDVFFFDADRGFAVGGSSDTFGDAVALVLATTDGGQTWEVRHRTTDPGEWGWKISFPSPDTGYVAIEDVFPSSRTAKVLRTTDGGLTWEEIRIDDSFPLQGIGFVTPQTGWISGRGTTSVTTDGGQTWTEINLDGEINRFRMLGDTLGYAVGKRVYRFAPATPTGVAAPADLPRAFVLAPNYPNPFGRATTLAYTLDAPGPVRLTVHDLLGRTLATLADGMQAAGPHAVRWRAVDAGGAPLPAGVYLYRLAAGGRVQTGRMVLTR